MNEQSQRRAPQAAAAVGAAAPLPLAALSRRAGLELLAGMMRGELPPPPITESLNFTLVEAEAGRVVFEGAPDARFFNPLGSIHGGWSATLLDSCVGCAVHSLLPAGKGYTTVELKVNFVRPVMPDSGLLRAEGRTIHVGGRVGIAEGRLTDANGRLYAHATTTCLIFEFMESAR